MPNDINKLMQFIAEHFTFDDKTHPELEGASGEERLAFAVRHLGLHLAKSLGKITAISERVDHGEKMDLAELKTNTPKLLITVLRLAEIFKIKRGRFS